MYVYFSLYINTSELTEPAINCLTFKGESTITVEVSIPTVQCDSSFGISQRIHVTWYILEEFDSNLALLCNVI